MMKCKSDRKTSKLTPKERLELVCQISERQDGLRASIANRAALVISADALLLASVTFSLETALSSASAFNAVEKTTLMLAVGVAVILLALSLLYATTGVASVWKPTRQRYGNSLPQRLFFHADDSIKTLKRFEVFRERFMASTIDELLTYALAELWSMEKVYYDRYLMLIRSIKLLVLAIIPFLIAISVLFIRFI